MSSLAAIGAVVAILLLQLALALNPAEGAGIRDAEIEHTIRAYASPLLRAAGLDPDDVGLHIVNDKALNAFVSRGRRIFLTSGLLMSAERPEQVVGVLAHEIGHITGGHLARLGGALDDARNQALIGQIIGFAFGVLSKDGGVAAATSAKGADIAFKNLLRFSRTQERSADQVAVNLLDQTRITSTGLLKFFERLQDQELLVARAPRRIRGHPSTDPRPDHLCPETRRKLALFR